MIIHGRWPEPAGAGGGGRVREETELPRTKLRLSVVIACSRRPELAGAGGGGRLRGPQDVAVSLQLLAHRALGRPAGCIRAV